MSTRKPDDKSGDKKAQNDLPRHTQERSGHERAQEASDRSKSPDPSREQQRTGHERAQEAPNRSKSPGPSRDQRKTQGSSEPDDSGKKKHKP